MRTIGIQGERLIRIDTLIERVKNRINATGNIQKGDLLVRLVDQFELELNDFVESCARFPVRWEAHHN